jgi:hypothetical protein
MNPPVRTSGTAIASLVFGILAWVGLFFIGALVAVICGHVARSEIRRMPPGEVDGDGLAIAGMILGYAQLALCLLGLLLFIAILIFGFSISGMH